MSYSKLLNVYYTDAEGEATPLTVIPLGYGSDVSGSAGWENWFASVPYVYLDGISQIVNVTYQNTDAGTTYTATPNVSVVASGPTPTTSTIPAAYASPTGFAADIDSYIAATSASYAGAAKTLLFNNVFTNGTVVAAQSYSEPNVSSGGLRLEEAFPS